MFMICGHKHHVFQHKQCVNGSTWLYQCLLEYMLFKHKYLSMFLTSSMLNYQLSQKHKLLGNCEFNHLTISLTLLLTCGP